METRHSSQSGIVIKRDPAAGWAHYDTNDGGLRKVGPWYRTQAELLADHEAYLIRAGWLKPLHADK